VKPSDRAPRGRTPLSAAGRQGLPAAVAALIAAATPLAALSQAGALVDLNYRSESYSSGELLRRGYVMSQRVEAQGSSYWQFWWNAASAQCVRVAINSGQVTQVIDTDAASCSQHAGGASPGPGPATDDLANQSVERATREIARRGYVLSNEVAAQGSSYWQFWRHAASGRCVRLAVNGGQVTQVITADAGSCDRPAGGGPGSGPGAADLVNWAVDQADREMSRRGYAMSQRVAASGSSYWQFWWNAARSQCVRLAINNGMVSQVIDADASACNQAPGGSSGVQAQGTDDLMHQSVDFAQRELLRRGYVLTNTESSRSEGYWQYWWNRQRAECARLAINDGRVTQITMADAQSCRQ
jgi:hypothetical protein